MSFEDVPEMIEGLETVNDLLHFGPKSRKKVAEAYAIYAYSLLAAFPLCFPSEQAMLCNPPTDGRIEYVTGTSAGSMVTTLTGNVMVRTDGTGRLYILHRPS